jgi:hypothetical protein
MIDLAQRPLQACYNTACDRKAPGRRDGKFAFVYCCAACELSKDLRKDLGHTLACTNRLCPEVPTISGPPTKPGDSRYGLLR